MTKISSHLPRRVAQIRRETFGDDGIPHLAEQLGLPAQTWQNYESGVMMPATVLLEFIAVTGASPGWLLNGEGDMFQGSPPAPRARGSQVWGGHSHGSAQHTTDEHPDARHPVPR